MPPLTEVEKEIILSSNEDVAWLPDVLNTLQSVSPTMERTKALAESASIIRSMIADGYVELCREKWTTPPRQRMLQPLTADEISNALEDEGSWVWIDSKDDYFALNRTQRGEEAFSNLVNRPS